MTEPAARVASEVVQGLKAQPTLLGLIVLNIIAITTATWFLNSVATRASNRLDLILTACLPSFKTGKE